MFRKLYDAAPGTVGFVASGKLTDFEYQTQFMPEVEDAIKRSGRINVLWKMENFDGWELHAAWDELMLAMKTKNAIGRIALVGEKPWQQHLPRYLKPFTDAEVRYYDSHDYDAAQEWVKH